MPKHSPVLSICFVTHAPTAPLPPPIIISLPFTHKPSPPSPTIPQMAHAGLIASVKAAAGMPRGTDYHGEIAAIDSDKRFQSGTTPATLFVLSPASRKTTAAALARRDAAVITDMSITITPGPRAISKVITVSAVWAPSDWGTIDTLEEMATIPGCVHQTFGGPFGLSASLVVPLNDLTPPILKSRITSVRPKLFMGVTSVDITAGPTVSAGSYIDVHYQCHYETFGGI